VSHAARVAWVARRPCSDFMDMSRRLINNCRIIIYYYHYYKIVVLDTINIFKILEQITPVLQSKHEPNAKLWVLGYDRNCYSRTSKCFCIAILTCTHWSHYLCVINFNLLAVISPVRANYRGQLVMMKGEQIAQLQQLSLSVQKASEWRHIDDFPLRRMFASRRMDGKRG